MKKLLLRTETYLKFLSSLKYDVEPSPIRFTKIICTLGPKNSSVEVLENLMAKGMNIARMNFSHGTHEYHAKTLETVRQAVRNFEKKLNIQYPLAIALDTKGPEIRTGLIEGQATAEVTLKDGEAISLSPNENYREKSTKDIVYVDYANILKLVKPGDRIFMDDGLISLTVDKVENDAVKCKIENGGVLGSQKGVNLPGIAVDLPAVSEKDKSDLQFGVKQKVDIVFASFIRDAEALKEIRSILGKKGKSIKIISKIENHQGLQNIDAIIEASDGIMVARGDMGIEIPPAKVVLAQKTIIARCNLAGKPVICATQMLESMTKKPRPTRAEVSDVANAVLDGADCVMLSGETAKGSFPLECVGIMSDICREAEYMIQYRKLYDDLVTSTNDCNIDESHAMSVAAVQAALKILASAIIVVSVTGCAGFTTSKYRPPCPIIMITSRSKVARRANLYRGVFGLVYENTCKRSDGDSEEIIEKGIEYGLKRELIKCGDKVVVLVAPQKESGFQEGVYIKTV